MLVKSFVSSTQKRKLRPLKFYNIFGRTEIDRNGCGAVIFAYAYIYEKGRNQGQYVQDLLW